MSIGTGEEAMPRKNDPFADLDNMSWDADFASHDSRRQKIFLIVVGLVIIGAIMTGVYYLLSGTLFDSPERAAERWLNALAKGDTDRMLELTCNDQLQTASILSLPEMVGGDALQELGLSEWLKNIDFDMGNLRYTGSEVSAGESEVMVRGILRIRAINDFWLPIPLNQRWRMIEEDNAWKWCGYLPQA